MKTEVGKGAVIAVGEWGGDGINKTTAKKRGSHLPIFSFTDGTHREWEIETSAECCHLFYCVNGIKKLFFV
jgi:hypothetical protein